MSDERTLYFYDFEFMEDGKTIVPISVGIVCEDGREFHLCNRDADLRKANDWVRSNVIPKLPPRHDPAWMPKTMIATAVKDFLLAGAHKPQLWGYYVSYDHVVLCQLFGRMIDLPKGLPQYSLDLKQFSVSLGSPKHPEQASGHHNALEDARWNRDLYAFLTKLQREREFGAVDYQHEKDNR